MFKSVTLRLTGWYLLILMAVSVVFSFMVYKVASNEVRDRLEGFQVSLQQTHDITPPLLSTAELRKSEADKAENNLALGLVYINFAVLIIGGLGSYFLAKRSIQPIITSHEAQSRFTSDASHELRTPLAVMKTELEVTLRDKDATNDELRETMSSNLEEVDRLSKLSEMLLSLSKLDHEKLAFKPTSISKLTRSVIGSYNDEAQKRLHIEVAEKIVVNCNAVAISDLIKILIDNALKYSPIESPINISLKKHNSNAVFAITNSGHGIHPDKLPHIFERFYRADESRTNGSEKGFGLGLALAKNIILLHKGELEVESDVDSDTTFTFYLPIFSGSQAKVQD